MPYAGTRVVGNVFLLSENDSTLKLLHHRIVPIVEEFNAHSKPPDPLYGVHSQLLESLQERLRTPKEQHNGVGFTVIGIPRNLRRLCIMDENDDDDYKAVIAQAQRIGTVLIAIVGSEGNGGPSSGRSSSESRTHSSRAEMLELNALYHPSLERVFKLQPRLNWFKERNLFFSFVDKLTPAQTRQIAMHLKPPKQHYASSAVSCVIS
jgi:hypothetical protein